MINYIDHTARLIGLKNKRVKENKITPVDWITDSEDLYVGTVSSGSNVSLTDNTASWTADEWVDKVVKISKNNNEDFKFALVESNNDNTLYFDDDVEPAVCSQCEYRIIPTYLVDLNILPAIIAMNIENNHGAVVLPNVTEDIERRYIHVYIENSANGQYVCPIIGRGTNYQIGAKYGTLEHLAEGVRLYAHNWTTPHWDVIQTFNIRRLAAGFWVENESITSSSWQILGGNNQIEYDYMRRFTPIQDNNQWIRYTSLVPSTFIANFKAEVQKTGAGGELTISFAKRSAENGVITYLEDRTSATSFGGGDGRDSIDVEIPVELSRNDELIPIAKRTSGTFSIVKGSSFKVLEF